MSIKELFSYIRYDYPKERVKICLCDSIDIEGIYEDKTPLQYAISLNRFEIVKLLIARGASTNKVDPSGRTPLAHCVESKNLEIAKHLIEMNANTCKPDENGATPLSLAVVYQNVDMMKLLLDNGAKYTINNTVNGTTTLMQSIKLGNLEITKHLIDMNANTCKPGNDGTTPLLLGVFRGNLEIIKVLLNNGAQSTINSSFLFQAICTENDEITTLLLQNCADIDKHNLNGDTLFIKCVRLEKFSTVKLLVQHGVNVNQKDQNGVTALEIALSNFDFRTFEFLIDSGADPNFATKKIEEMTQENEEFARYVKSMKVGGHKNAESMDIAPADVENLTRDTQNNEKCTGQDEDEEHQ